MSSPRPFVFTIVAGLLPIAGPEDLRAQSIYATLTGVVTDPAQAVVPNATVKLKNEQSGSLRETATNSEVLFTVASVVVGNFTYELTVEAKGFSTYKASGIAVSGGEKRNMNVGLA